MVRHTNFQYQAATKKIVGHRKHEPYNLQMATPIFTRIKGGYFERCADINACKTEQNAKKNK